MKEYRFRGRRLDNGEWVYGYYVKAGGAHKIYWTTVDGTQCCATVDPETVTQFIGLYDSEHSPIFEGDVLAGINDDAKVWTNIAAFDTENAGYIGYRCYEDLSIIGDPENLQYFHMIRWDATLEVFYLKDAIIKGNLWDMPEPQSFESSCIIAETLAEFRKYFQN